jgi:Lrp/AsnC family transcriptional regulator for asnA, asnC and gidA
MKYDEIDRKILEILDQDGRTRFTKIAKSIQRTEGTVRNRIKRLEDSGVIHGFTVVTSPENLGYEIQATIVFQLEPSYENYIQLDSLPNNMSNHDGKVVSLHRANGKDTFMLEVLCRNSYDLNLFISYLKNLTGIISLETLIKEEQIYDHFS